MTLDDVLNQIQARLGLEAETEHEVVEEIRGHLEEAVAAAKSRGLDEQQALREAAAAFGVEQATAELRDSRRLGHPGRCRRGSTAGDLCAGPALADLCPGRNGRCVA